jgi:hypothetical protein
MLSANPKLPEHPPIYLMASRCDKLAEYLVALSAIELDVENLPRGRRG